MCNKSIICGVLFASGAITFYEGNNMLSALVKYVINRLIHGLFHIALVISPPLISSLRVDIKNCILHLKQHGINCLFDLKYHLINCLFQLKQYCMNCSFHLKYHCINYLFLLQYHCINYLFHLKYHCINYLFHLKYHCIKLFISREISQYLQINTWAFPYWPGYHPEIPIYGSRDENQANMEMPMY